MSTYAFCLGINTYRAPIDALKCAERDARDLSSLLKERFGFESEYLEERRTEDIEDRIEHLESRLRPGDSFIFYFSGHGKAHIDDQYFLLPGCRYENLEASSGVTGGVLSWNSLKRLTARPKWRGVHRVFIFDACRTHLIPNKGAGERPAFDGSYLLRHAFGKRQENKDADAPPLTLINSCDEGKCAIELPGTGNGVFTSALMEGLKDGLGNGNEVLLDQDFVVNLGHRMTVLTKTHGLSDLTQNPVWKGAAARLTVPGAAEPKKQQGLSAEDKDEREWMLVSAAPSVAKLEAYIREAPKDSPHIVDAVALLKSLAVSADGPAAKIAAPAAALTPDVPSALSSADAIKAEGSQQQEQPVPPDEKKKRLAMTLILVFGCLSLVFVGLFGVSGKKEEAPAPAPAPAADAAPVVAPVSPVVAKSIAVRESFQDSLAGGGKGPMMVVIPSGSFKIGSNAYEDEKGGSTVTIAKAFAVGKYKVTEVEYLVCVTAKKCTAATASQTESNKPVVHVSWHDAKAYVAWLNEVKADKQGEYKLLSESEWEYAARAGSKTEWSFGDDESQLKDYAWYYANGGNRTHEVGTKAANAYGLYDMLGNACEWVEDVWHDNYQGAPRDGSAWTSGGNQSFRVMRGGSWINGPTYRGNFSPAIGYYFSGFRVARTAPQVR